MATVEPHPHDDEPVRMTVAERTVWAGLVSVVLSSGTYFALLATRLAGPVEDISWARPMAWTIGLAVVGTVILTIVLAIAPHAGRGGRCTPADHGEVTSDVRDRDIGRSGGQAATGVFGIGLGGALLLAMLDADTFWIGNLLFLAGTVGAIVEAITKIRLYRRGF